jgi:hypothetical protein
MNIIATKLSSAMSHRQGYISISDAMEPNLKSYTFSNCLKLKKDSLGFTKWVLYWEDADFVVVFTVLTTVLSTGYIKATIIDRELTDVNTVGEYTGKNSFTEVYLVQGKYVTGKSRDSIVTSALTKGDFSPTNAHAIKAEQKAVQNAAHIQAKVDEIAEAWGITPKKS